MSAACLSVLAACASDAGGQKKARDGRIPLTELADKQAEFDAADRKKVQERAREFDADAMVNVADNLRRAGNAMAALQVYQQARDREPEHLGAILGQAEMFLGLGAAEEAERRFRLALEILGRKDANQKDRAQQTGIAAAGVARALTRQNRATEALPYFDQAIASGAVDGDFFNYYGVTLDLLGRHTEAQLNYGKGLDLKREDPALTNNLALSFALSENYETSVRLLSTVVTAHPEAETARKNLALVYGLSGDLDAAEGIVRSNQTAEAATAQMNYIRQLVAMSPELRAHAIFLGLDQVPAPARPASPPPQPEAAATPPAPEPAPVQAPEPPKDPQMTQPDKQPVDNVAIQVGAYPTRAEAERGWSRTRKAADSVLAELGQEPVFWQADKVVRVVLPVAEGWGQAKSLCERLQAVGVGCLARRLPDLSR